MFPQIWAGTRELLDVSLQTDGFPHASLLCVCSIQWNTYMLGIHWAYIFILFSHNFNPSLGLPFRKQTRFYLSSDSENQYYLSDIRVFKAFKCLWLQQPLNWAFCFHSLQSQSTGDDWLGSDRSLGFVGYFS